MIELLGEAWWSEARVAAQLRVDEVGHGIGELGLAEDYGSDYRLNSVEHDLSEGLLLALSDNIEGAAPGDRHADGEMVRGERWSRVRALGRVVTAALWSSNAAFIVAISNDHKEGFTRATDAAQRGCSSSTALS